MDSLIEQALAGDARSLARLLSRVEMQNDESVELMKRIYPHTGRAHTIGITGSPGAGKSTLTARLIADYRARGKKVGVIAVDPSSPYTGGAILGDRLRMQEHALDGGVFIRSMGSRGNLGGLSGATHEVSLILDACGYDIVIIETVGVGQSEVDVVKVSDTVCLVLVPGMGDDVQIMKAGIMEIADVFVVNKCDRDGAEKVAADVKVMLDLIPERGWRPPVSLASAEFGKGIEDVTANIDAHRKYLEESTYGKERRSAKIAAEIKDILRREVFARVEKVWEDEREKGVLQRVEARESDPYTAAAAILAGVLKGDRTL